MLGLLALFLFPIIDVYRDFAVYGGWGGDIFLAVELYLESPSIEGGNLLTAAPEKLLHRLLGFTQFAGLITDSAYDHSYIGFQNGSDIASYYTREYLGILTPGHSSSPSLLGIFYILGGSAYWSLFLLMYLVFVLVLWRFTESLPNFEYVAKCLVAYEVFNTIIAGTVDASLIRLALSLVVVFFLELLLSAVSLRER
jgi:hypothetical protein